MPIVRSPDEVRVTSRLRDDLRRRAYDTLVVGGVAAVAYWAAPLLGVTISELRAHFWLPMLLPWIGQLLVLPNSLGADVRPSFALRISRDAVSLERYGIPDARVARPAVLVHRRWWSPFSGSILRGTDRDLRLPDRVFGEAEYRTLDALLADTPPSSSEARRLT